MIGDSFLDVSLQPDQLRFEYGPGVVGPATEFRSLDAIRGEPARSQLRGPRSGLRDCDGCGARVRHGSAERTDASVWNRRVCGRTPGRGTDPQPGPRACHCPAQRLVASGDFRSAGRQGHHLCAADHRERPGRLHRGDCPSRREGRGSAGMGALRDQCGPGAPHGIRRVVRPAIWLRLRRCTAARRSGVVSGADRERRDRVARESLISKAQSACAPGAYVIRSWACSRTAACISNISRIRIPCCGFPIQHASNPCGGTFVLSGENASGNGDK